MHSVFRAARYGRSRRDFIRGRLTFDNIHAQQQRRWVSDAVSISPVLALKVFIGLPIALWTYKCLMLVLFQRKIIYMPFMPPGNKSMTIAEQSRRNVDGLSVLPITTTSRGQTTRLGNPIILQGIQVTSIKPEHSKENNIVVLYFQGNAGTPLHRLSKFRRIIDFQRRVEQQITIVAFAPRSYWSSTPVKPTEQGLINDYESALMFAVQKYGPNAHYFVYGHSLGGAATIHTVLRHISDSDSATSNNTVPISGVILENPMASIPEMVQAIYPQKWLPYHYLGTFAFDTWNSQKLLLEHKTSTTIPALFLLSEMDEIIPYKLGEALHESWNRSMGPSKCVIIGRALHETACNTRNRNQIFSHEIAGVMELGSKSPFYEQAILHQMF